jgi:hypothetical protein
VVATTLSDCWSGATSTPYFVLEAAEQSAESAGSQIGPELSGSVESLSRRGTGQHDAKLLAPLVSSISSSQWRSMSLRGFGSGLRSPSSFGKDAP